MSGQVIANHSGSFAPMPDIFRFSPHPNQAHTVRWRTWGKAAFSEAIQEDKPIFLMITSSWCQWCHVMDETTLSEPSIIAIINADYIPIRVDSDLRPDVNQRYNQNGWPSVVLLSAEGEILWGGVYVSPQQMLYYLGHVRRYYSEHRVEISQQVSHLRMQSQKISRSVSTTPLELRSLTEEERVTLSQLPRDAGFVLRDLYDSENGGFSIHPNLKFPHPEALELLLLLAQQNQQADALEMVRYSLIQMRDGGLWDREEGGFFRYSAASDWSTPHTEKMLDENASLLRLILLTARMTKEAQWFDLARGLISYINATLWQADTGVFSGSQCADSDYYEPGLYSRASQQAPRVDLTIYTSWNAHMISTYLLAAQILGEHTYCDMALQALNYLCEHMLHSGGSAYHYALAECKELPGQLADQVWMTKALLDAYEMTERKSYLETAISLMHFSCQQLLDAQSELFFDYPAGSESIGRLTIREQPLEENVLAAECLLRMSIYSKRQNLRDTGLRVLSGCLPKYRRTGIQGAIYACVVARALDCGWL